MIQAFFFNFFFYLFTFDIITNSNIESLFHEDINVSTIDDNLSEDDTRNQFSVDIEQIFIELYLHKKFIVGTLYPSPMDDINVYLQHAQSIGILKNK